MQIYQEDFGVDVSELVGAGAAGGLAGGLAAVGATLMPGFELIAEACDLATQLESVDLVITGEGRVDASSFQGKVVGGVVEHAESFDVPVLVVAGQVEGGFEPPVPVVDLATVVGVEQSMSDVAAAIAQVLPDHLADL